MLLYLVHPIPKKEEVATLHSIGSTLPWVADPSPDPSVHPCFFNILYPMLEECTGGRMRASKPRRALDVEPSLAKGSVLRGTGPAGVIVSALQNFLTTFPFISNYSCIRHTTNVMK